MSGDSQRAPAPNADPEPLALRARPRPVTRFNRKVLIGIAALVCVVVFAATLIALEPVRFGRQGQDEELINTERKAKAEGLDALPRSYSEIKPPELGPPLQGDIGPPVVRMERELGVDQGFRPDAEADAERAERLRLARQAQQAREATVFFQIAARREPALAAASVASTPGVPNNSASPVPAPTAGGDQTVGASGQGHKSAFLNARSSDDVFNPHRLELSVSPDQVLAGTVIAASLVTGINSDLPGFVIAQVTENVFDTVTGRRLLIPQGTKLIGKYDSVVSFGQRRALVVWNRMILPDGSSIVVDNLPATDAGGYAGLEDEVEFHTWQLIKGAVLSTLLGVGSEVGASNRGSSTDALSAARESVQQNAARIGQQLTERNLDIQPTITIRAGFPLRVIVHKDLILREYKM
ncbi:MAG: TrbI/VirB10 family protein [Alphaproteobacteria bacterium]|nr:TrbI/VirB10 family protein [Alphaproteobacteria bacterium]